ncbi:MAG TPA: hypothetical protein VIE65_01600 [Methylobacter sp.]
MYSLTLRAFTLAVLQGMLPLQAGAFECERKYLTVDYITCGDEGLLTAETRLEEVYKELRSMGSEKDGLRLRDEERKWSNSWWKECGLPKTGMPTVKLAASARRCILEALRSREVHLRDLIEAGNRKPNSSWSPEKPESVGDTHDSPSRRRVPPVSRDDGLSEGDRTPNTNAKSDTIAFIPTHPSTLDLNVELDGTRNKSQWEVFRITGDKSVAAINRVVINNNIGSEWCDTVRNLSGLYVDQKVGNGGSIEVIANKACGDPKSLNLYTDRGNLEFRLKPQ